MPEVTTTPELTVLDDLDEMYVADVSGTPDVLSRIKTANARKSFGAKVLQASRFATLQDAFTAFADADESVLEFDSDAVYEVTEEVTAEIDVGVQRVIRGNGAKININVPGSPYLGVNFGTSGKLTVDGFDVEQTGANAYAFTVGAGGAVRFQNNRFTACFQALRVGGGGPASPVFIVDNEFYGGTYGLYNYSEYVVCDRNFFNAVPTGIIALSPAGGNFRITNNTICFCSIGIKIESETKVVGIRNNTINHNLEAGIYVDGSIAGVQISNNEIEGQGGANLGASPKDSSFGIYLKDCTGFHIVANTIGVNVANVALENCDHGKVNNNDFIALDAVTIYQIKEVGAASSGYMMLGNTFKDNAVHTTVLATDCPNADITGVNIIV